MAGGTPFDDDLKILEKYQAHSAELVRIALLGIAGIGTLLTLKHDQVLLKIESAVARPFFILALLGLGFSAACAVMHRYFSTDGLTCQLKIYRLEAVIPPDAPRIQGEKVHRNRAFKLSTWTIWGGAVFLAFGAVCLAIAFCIVLWKR